MTLSEATALVAILKSNWPKHPVQKEAPLSFQMALSGTPFETVHAATAWWIAEEKWFPAASEIRDRVRLLERGVTISDLALATQLRQMLGQDVLAAGATAPALTETTT